MTKHIYRRQVQGGMLEVSKGKYLICLEAASVGVKSHKKFGFVGWEKKAMPSGSALLDPTILYAGLHALENFIPFVHAIH